MAGMRKQYGKRAKEVFYASIKKGVKGSSKWHLKRSRKKKGNPGIDEHPAKRMSRRMANLDKARRGVLRKSKEYMDFSHM